MLGESKTALPSVKMHVYLHTTKQVLRFSNEIWPHRKALKIVSKSPRSDCLKISATLGRRKSLNKFASLAIGLSKLGRDRLDQFYFDSMS